MARRRRRRRRFTQVVTEQSRTILWPATPPSETDGAKYKQVVAHIGKAAPLRAAAEYEYEFPDLVTLCVGIGPGAAILARFSA